MVHRILHIVSGDLWGGAEAQMSMQIPAMISLGHDVAVICFNDDVCARKYRELGITVFVAEESKGFRDLLSTSRSLAAEYSPTVLVAHGYKETFLAWRISTWLSCPWISWFHGLSEGYSGLADVKSRMYEFVKLFLAKRFAARMIVVSKDAATRLGIADHSKTKVVYNVYQPAQDNQSLALDSFNRPALVSVGRLTAVKRFDRAINSFLNLFDVEKDLNANLYIIGEGPLEQELKDLVCKSSWNERVHFLGFKDNAARYIAAADVLLLSSDSEGVPTVMLEALYAQVPVVSTAVGGIPEVLEKFSGYPAQLASCDESSLSEAISKSLATLVESDGANQTWSNTYQDLFSPVVAAKSLCAELDMLSG